MIISSSCDKTIRIWDITTGTCLKIFNDCNLNMRFVCISDNLIISGRYDKTIKITPISLFPGELRMFQQVNKFYYLAHHLEREILNYFKGE